MIAPRRMDRPEPGYWLMRLVRNGPRMPAAIFWHETTGEPGEPENTMHGTRPRFLSAMIAGKVVALDDVWLRRGDTITKAEYDFRVADAEWSRQHALDEPQAQPHKPINYMTAPLPF